MAQYRGKPMSEREADTTARIMQNQLLKLRTFCPMHRRWYNVNHVVDGRMEGRDCPRCTDDRQWARKAVAQLRAEGVELTLDVVRDRATALAGHVLMRYPKP